MKQIGQILISIIILSFTSCSAQNECEKLRDKEVSLSYISEHKDEFITDYKTLIACYYDSIDVQIFENNIDEIVSEFITLLKSVELSENPKEYGTYNDFLERLNEIRKTDEYLNIRIVVTDLNEINIKKPDMSNWKTDSVILRKITYTDYDISNIKKIVLENKNNEWTYYDVLQELATVYYISDTSELKSINYKDLFVLPYELKGFFEYTEGIEYSKKVNKPIFLYFTGHGSVNSRIFEANILSDKEIQRILKQEYIIISLNTDDKNIAKSEYFIISEKDTLKQIKSINLYYQKKMFSENIQPAIHILNSSGDEIIEPYDFNKSSVSLLKNYLIEGIKRYNNN